VPIQARLIIFIFIHQNGGEKHNNTKTTKSERKIEADNLSKQIKTYKPLPIQFMIYSTRTIVGCQDSHLTVKVPARIFPIPFL